MRKCKICGEEKELEKFRKRLSWRSHTCKKCHSAKYVSGKKNTGRFKKGHIPWIKGKKDVKKRDSPRYIKVGRKLIGIGKQSANGIIWSLAVKSRDKFKCVKCGLKENLQAHHIDPWKVNEKKRFDVENGITLCPSCHMKEERIFEIAKGIRQKNGFGKLK
jgi:hypothetical protein